MQQWLTPEFALWIRYWQLHPGCLVERLQQAKDSNAVKELDWSLTIAGYRVERYKTAIAAFFAGDRNGVTLIVQRRLLKISASLIGFYALA